VRGGDGESQSGNDRSEKRGDDDPKPSKNRKWKEKRIEKPVIASYWTQPERNKGYYLISAAGGETGRRKKKERNVIVFINRRECPEEVQRTRIQGMENPPDHGSA